MRQRWAAAVLVGGVLLSGCSVPANTAASTTSTPPSTEVLGPTTAVTDAGTVPTSVATTTTTALPPTAPPSSTSAGQWTPPAQTATSGCTLHGADPDPACTPGALNPAVNQTDIGSTICLSGWSAQARAAALPASRSAALKRKVAAYYEPRGDPATSEGDHLIAIELGGDPSGGPNGNGANFFDEPHTLTGPDGRPAGSAVKDTLENALHRLVCSGAMALNEAQREIATDWYGSFEQLLTARTSSTG